MMLPVLSSEYFVYHYMQNLLSSEYIDSRIMSRTTAKSTAVDYILGRHQCLHVMVYKVLKTTAQVASFESPL